jgi:hypothetical protein
LNYNDNLFVPLYAAIELIKDLMSYDVRDALLRGLVKLLRPSKEDMLRRPELFEGKTLSNKYWLTRK